MESRGIEITNISARDLHNPNNLSKPKPYADVWISNDYESKQRTSKDKVHRTNPIWDKVMKFNLDGDALQQDGLDLEIAIYTLGTLKQEKLIGLVSIPLNKLLAQAGVNKGATTSAHIYSSPVRNISGQDEGTIKIAVKLVENPKVKLQAVTGSSGAGKAEPETAYPAGSCGASNAEPVVPVVPAAAQQATKNNTRKWNIALAALGETGEILGNLGLEGAFGDLGFDGGDD